MSNSMILSFRLRKHLNFNINLIDQAQRLMACRLGDESFLGFELVRKIVIGESSCCCNYNFCQVNGDAELDVHVFIGQPSLPGLPCPGEDRNVYRRGARRWKKFYLYNGHRFQAKRLNRRIHCFICHDYIWGLGRQGYRCVDCRLCVHKKCHRLVREHCEQKPLAEQPHRPPPAPLPSALRGGSGERRSTVGVDNGAFQDFV